VSWLSEAAGKTPDPSRSLKNLETFLSANPGFEDMLREHIQAVSMLFACSQFLANYSVRKPGTLARALNDLSAVPRRKDLAEELSERLGDADHETALAVFRDFKKEKMIGITVRDILGLADTVESMEQMSDLADAVIDTALHFIRDGLARKYGMPEDYSFAVFALGKLGAQELNYSSDVDLIFVYRDEKGETSGIRSPSGTVINSIGNHEFYCKLATELGRFLSQNTSDGFVYRVDMRLRPDGQRGDTALSLRSYELYYESWGREWERLALIRARFICGDEQLGQDFIEMITPFVWRKYIDYSTIDEIRGLKSRIDATFRKDDIKRGFGGIREIEFFIQSMQLIYGGREPLLRQRKTLIALHMLKQKNLIGEEDHAFLAESYIHLRRIEHFVQMLNDVQTHVLPVDAVQREALAAKMKFPDFRAFQSDLQERRMRIRDTYNQLFGPPEDMEADETSSLIFEEDLSDAELRQYLASKGLTDVDEAARHVSRIKDEMAGAHTLRGRRMFRAIVPGMVEKALTMPAAENALRNLVQFVENLSANEPYLHAFIDSRMLADALVEVFSRSDYISRMILGNPEYLDILSGGAPRRKTLAEMKKELEGMIASGMPLNYAVRVFRKSEEIRLGLMFLNRSIGVVRLTKGLTRVAEVVVDAVIRETCREAGLSGSDDICVAAMGKFGGREITVGSDLDILFYVTGELNNAGFRAAERFLRVLQAYTGEGIAYRVDTRLRPDGTKGPLVNNIAGYRNYYLEHADSWEIQALLKARPVSYSRDGLCSFMKMREDVFRKRAAGVSREDIIQMRRRIMSELKKPGGGIDIKLDRGGIEEIEFAVQYLQLRSAGRLRVFPQGTIDALRRLDRAGLIGAEEKARLEESYRIFRRVESYMRLSMQNTIRPDSRETKYLAEFMGHDKVGAFLDDISERMERVAEITEEIYSGG